MTLRPWLFLSEPWFLQLKNEDYVIPTLWPRWCNGVMFLAHRRCSEGVSFYVSLTEGLKYWDMVDDNDEYHVLFQSNKSLENNKCLVLTSLWVSRLVLLDMNGATHVSVMSWGDQVVCQMSDRKTYWSEVSPLSSLWLGWLQIDLGWPQLRQLDVLSCDSLPLGLLTWQKQGSNRLKVSCNPSWGLGLGWLLHHFHQSIGQSRSKTSSESKDSERGPTS